MQIKRSPIPNSNPKQTNLIQPLIGIAKASTPVRTRIIGANSTPINQAKLSNFHKSPNNKENHSTNHIKIEGGVKTYATQETENRINLSPILSINKKINEGLKPQPKKSLTPEGSKVNEDYDNYGNNQNQNMERNYQTLNQSKGYQGYNNTTNFSNLRTSNSFKSLIQARCKTPNRFQPKPVSIIDSKREQPVLKESMSSNQLFKQYTRQSKPKLAESRSFDRFKPLSTLSSLQSDIKCMNNDGKKAKYRVINEDSDESSDMQLYYCSKCTIPLVQQGFLVEEIGKDNQKEEMADDNARWIGQYRSKLQSKRNSIEFILKDITQREHQSMSELERYYNGVMQFIEQQRNADAKSLEDFYQTRKSQPTKYLQQISYSLQTLSNPKTKPSLSDLNRILSTDDKQLISECSFQLNSQDLLGNFIKNYGPGLRLSLQPSFKTQLSKPNDPINSRNHAMRFSFQKLLTDIHHKKSSIQSIMNPLQEEDEEYTENEEVVRMGKDSHTAFRDLFPEVEEAEQVNNGIHSPTFKSF